MKRIVGVGVALVLSASLAGPAAAMSSGGGGSGGSTRSSSSPGYSDAERAVKNKQYRKAISILEGVIRRDPNNVDALNYLGYSHRQLGEYDKALIYYQTALAKDRNHRGVNEYLGQLYLRLGKMKQARAQLARLRQICGAGCEEYESLKAAIDRSRRG